MIAVVLPSRGTIFTEVEMAIEKERKIHDLQVFRSYDLPIPDCLTVLTEEALKIKPDYIWYIEEDTVPPPEILSKMIFYSNHQNIVTVDYPLANGASSIWRKKSDNSIVFCGFGCTLVPVEVFTKLDKPYFRIDKQLNIDTLEWITVNPKKETYGTHDIYFFKSIVDIGYKIEQIPDILARHLKLEEYGKTENNKGLHKISLKADKIIQRYTI